MHGTSEKRLRRLRRLYFVYDLKFKLLRALLICRQRRVRSAHEGSIAKTAVLLYNNKVRTRCLLRPLAYGFVGVKGFIPF